MFFTENKKIQFTMRFYRAKQTNTETPEDHWEIIWIEKKCNVPEFSTEILLSDFITKITDIKIRDKLLKEKHLDIPKLVD